MRGRRPGDRDDEPRVVLELAVPRQQAAAQPVRRSGGAAPSVSAAGQAARSRQRPPGGARGQPQPVAGEQPGAGASAAGRA